MNPERRGGKRSGGRGAETATKRSRANLVPDAPSFPLFERLPSDLVQLVLSHIPTRPRIMVLSLVCKKWRAIVIRTIKFLPPLPFDRLAAALAQLPSVTALSINYPSARFRTLLPPSLRELKITPFMMGPCPCADLVHVSDLTLLALNIHHCAHMETIIRNNAPTLESLILTLASPGPFSLPRKHTSLQKLMIDAPFPMLHSLCMRGSTDDSELISEVIFKFRTQLKRVALECWDRKNRFAKMVRACAFKSPA